MIKKQKRGEEKGKILSSEGTFTKSNISSFCKKNSTNKHYNNMKDSNKENINMNENNGVPNKSNCQKSKNILNENCNKNNVNEVKKIRGLKKIELQNPETKANFLLNPTLIVQEGSKHKIEEASNFLSNTLNAKNNEIKQSGKIHLIDKTPLPNFQVHSSFQEKTYQQPQNELMLSELNLHCNETLPENVKQNEIKRKIIKKIIPIHSLNVSAINNSVLSNSDLSLLNEINPYKNQNIIPHTSKEGGTKMLFRRSKSPSNGISGASSTLITFPKKENFIKSATEGTLLDLQSVQRRIAEDKLEIDSSVPINDNNNVNNLNLNVVNLENQVNEYAQKLEKINKKYEKLFSKLRNEKAEVMQFKIKTILGNSSFIKLDPKGKSEELLNLIILIINDFKNTKNLLKEQNRVEKNELLSRYKEMKNKIFQ